MKTSKLHKLPLFISLVLLFYSCGINKLSLDGISNTYQGTVFLSNGEKKTGYITMPQPSSKSVLFKGQDNTSELSINATDVDKIVFEYAGNHQVVRYMPIKKVFGRTSAIWVLQVAEGRYASAYIGAERYSLNPDGTVKLEGTRQVINTGTSRAIIQPSFPVYMLKEGGKALVNVALKEGIKFEGSAFRSGVSHYLFDDPTLCEHMRQEKWDFDNIGTIITNYDPHRGNNELVIDGKVIEPKKRSLLTNDFDGEMFFSLEAAFPTDDLYGPQFGLGIRTSKYKFLTYGADLGFASAKYIDQVKWLENHPVITGKPETPATDTDFSKSTLFRVNAFAGGQLPFCFGKIYVIPAAHIVLGGMVGSGYNTLYYGPMGTLDLGFRLKRGDIFFIGAGYRHNISLISDKESSSVTGFDAYEPYGNLLVRIGYKF